ncbi:MAG: O-antigen polymerase [Cyclobacteriaceae bacterium]
MNSEETVCIIFLTIICLGIPYLNWAKKDPIQFWSPLTILCIIMLYYAVIGPFVTVYSGQTVYKLIDHRPFFLGGWILTLVGMISTIIGFNIISSKVKHSSLAKAKDDYLNGIAVEKTAWKPLVYLALICIIALVGTGGLIDQVAISRSAEGSLFQGTNTSFGGYLLNGINLLIGACVLLFIYCLKYKERWWLFLLLCGFTFAVYTKQGFRWRHISLILALAGTYYIYYNKKINLILFSVLGFFLLGVMGFIGLTRAYGAGLDYSNVDNVDNWDLILAGFGESSVFMTTSLLIHKSAQFLPTEFIGLDPLFQTVFMPIPRALWPGKPSGDYLSIVVSLYDEVFVDNGLGAAIFNFGEYYLMYGWISVILGGLLLGWLFKKAWLWFLKHRRNKLAIVTYAVFFSYIYMIISRGYTPQVVMLFFFTVYPLYFIFNYHYKRVKLKKARFAHS